MPGLCWSHLSATLILITNASPSFQHLPLHYLLGSSHHLMDPDLHGECVGRAMERVMWFLAMCGWCVRVSMSLSEPLWDDWYEWNARGQSIV